MTNSVSLHVRRGDYVSNTSYATCTKAYYDAAIKKLLEVEDFEPRVFVFSDEPMWARDNLSVPGHVTIVDHNGEDQDFEDMRLMSLCKHNIIANSSFSWWGAWLNQNPDRITVAPKRWFGQDALANRDIWASGWHKV